MSQQRHWKSSYMSPSRIDNYIYHRDAEHYYQVEIWDKPPDINAIPQWLDAVYYDDCLYFTRGIYDLDNCSEIDSNSGEAMINNVTIAGIREFINENIDDCIYEGLRAEAESHLNKFICDLLKLKLQSRNMLAGIAVHEYLEKLLIGELPSDFTHNGWQIITDDKLNVELELPLNREQWCERYFGDIKILGKTDCIGISQVNDIKTTSDIKIEKYMESWQWQIYLWITGRNKFVYNIFEIDINKYTDKVTIKDYQELTLYRYKGMEERIINILHEYSNYLDMIKPHIDKLKEATNEKK